ncbi:hypothetical protein [Deinococcus multiflagellatus]|uniref:HD-GYP domain-containing protein n=1 Tax=Deinococcus multiflagellatus TaxID=1656887 RepID=A0ABW1ZNT2_9DEIO
MAIADTFDALVSDRPYRAGWSRPDARAYVLARGGCQFDPRLLLAFELATA